MDRSDDPLNSVRVVVTANGSREIKEAAVALGLKDSEVLRQCLLIIVPEAAKKQRAAGTPITLILDRVCILTNVPNI